MAKTNSIAKFDNSLTEYLINALTDKYGDTVYYTHRYHNLKVFMNPREIPEPHFFVALGISQACFSLSSGKKLNGGLGEEDGYVKRWAERTNINNNRFISISNKRYKRFPRKLLHIFIRNEKFKCN